MDRRDIAFAAACRIDAAEAADGDGARAKAALGKRADHDIERDIVAAHDDEIGRALAFADQRHLGAASASSAEASASIAKKPSACENAVTAPEPLPVGNAIGPSSPATSDDQHEFLAAEFGSDPHRHARSDGFCRFRRQSGAGADERRDEGVEGENRRGRKARQHDQRLVADHREAQRLAGFERHAVNENAGRTEPRHDAMRQIARAFRRAAGEHHDVARFERVAHGRFERGLFVRKRAERDRLAAGFDDRRGEDGAVAVIDAAGPERPARLDQLVAGREHRDARPAHDVDRRQTAGRQHADLARADLAAAAEQSLAARDVGAGIGDELAARRGAAQIDRRRRGVLDQFGLLDHHHRIGAARDDPAGGDRGRGARHHFERRRNAAGDHFGVERKPLRRAVARADRIGRAHGKAVDIGAIERRRIDRRDRRRPQARGRAPRRAARFRPAAANDRCALQTAGALPPRTPLRGIAPAARRGAPHRGLPGRGCSVRASWPWHYGDLRARWKTFAVGGNDDPTVAARQRCQ